LSQDDENRKPRAHQNFKLVPWEKIAEPLNLIIDNEYVFGINNTNNMPIFELGGKCMKKNIVMLCSIVCLFICAGCSSTTSTLTLHPKPHEPTYKVAVQRMLRKN